MASLEEQNANLKLQLNQSQQLRASLELQLRQKEEIAIKCESELMKKENEFSKKEESYDAQIKSLQEKLDALTTASNEDNDLEKLKMANEKLKAQLSDKMNEEANYKTTIDEYHNVMKERLEELEKVKHDLETAKNHLATLEMAFSDIHQKYERAKSIIVGYKKNEEMLAQTIALSSDDVRKSEEKYETLKAHAKAQIEKSNKEINLVREKHQAEVNKHTAIIKRMEIKIASLNVALEQKTKECAQLAALCDDITGKVE